MKWLQVDTKVFFIWDQGDVDVKMRRRYLGEKEDTEYIKILRKNMWRRYKYSSDEGGFGVSEENPLFTRKLISAPAYIQVLKPAKSVQLLKSTYQV